MKKTLPPEGSPARRVLDAIITHHWMFARACLRFDGDKAATLAAFHELLETGKIVIVEVTPDCFQIRTVQ